MGLLARAAALFALAAPRARTAGARLAAPSPPPALPTLAWELRSDWQLVTAFGAKGDGKTDDTGAIQAALAFVQRSGQGAAPNKTVFFPAGTYLITSTLLLNDTSGVLLLGTGATTTLLWGGGSAPAPPPDGGVNRLLWLDGCTRFHIEGFVFDGAGVGEVGLDHDSHNVYESRVVHRNLAFLRWQTAGIRVGHRQTTANGVASAEMIFSNCVFASNYAGVQLLAWNGALGAGQAALPVCRGSGMPSPPLAPSTSRAHRASTLHGRRLRQPLLGMPLSRSRGLRHRRAGGQHLRDQHAL
jgi:hypothetical protein